MRKWMLAFLLATVLLGTSGICLAADNVTITPDSQDQSGQINVNYNSDVSYMVTIPASVTFTDAEKEAERPLEVTNILIPEGTSLYITVSSLNDFRMKNNDGYIGYSLKINYNSQAVQNNSPVLIIDAGKASGWAVLGFATDLKKDHALYPGNFADTLTFTVTVE